jgi:hypothetical protein
MTVSNQTNRTSATGSGATGQEIPFSFPITNTSDLVCYKLVVSTGVQSTLDETTNYTVSITGDTGGTVTTVTAIETTEQIHVVRNTPFTQALDLAAGGSFTAEDIEDAIDKNTKLAIQNKDTLDNKVMRYPESDSTSLTTEIPDSVDRASKVLSFDSSGNVTASSAVPTGSVSFTTFGTSLAETATAITAKALLNGDQVVDGRDYDADGDGSDQTTEIAAAIAAISGSGVVVLPEGTFIVSSTITIPTGVIVTGVNTHYAGAQGTRITSTVDAAACFKVGDGSTLSHSAGVKNMRITASGTGIDGIGIHFSYVRWCEIDNVNVTGFTTGTGIKIEGQTASTLPSAQNTVSNVYLANNLVNLFLTGQNANDTSACDESNFTNIRIQPTTLSDSIGIRMRKGINNTFRNIVIADTATTTGTVGIDLVNGGATDDVYCTRGNSFFNVSLEFLATGIAIGTLPHSNSFYDTRIHAAATYTPISDSSGGGNRFIGLTGGENILNMRWQWPLPANSQNLLINGEMERWSNGLSSAPTGWTVSGAAGETIAREKTTVHKGAHSCKLVSGTANAEVYQDIADYKYIAGRYVAMSAWVYANYTESSTAVVRIHISDDSGTEAHSYSRPHSGTAGWELLSCRKKIVAATTQIRANLSIASVATTAYFDQVILVEGLDVPLPGPTAVNYSNFDDIISPQMVFYESGIVTYDNEVVTYKE